MTKDVPQSVLDDIASRKWKISSDKRFGGGQAYVVKVKHEDGRDGALRWLKHGERKARDRFKREVKILTEQELQHPSIVKILEFSAEGDPPWFISQWGQSFYDHWNEKRARLRNEPEDLAKDAFLTVTALLEGLAPLHIRGVVHRDIKPSNIVVAIEDGRTIPVLIDFGLAYVSEEPRISSADEATGNRIFSPDAMMYRLDHVPPWLDVFEMSQLLIWLTQDPPEKEWQRARDWRWVRYDSRLPDRLLMSLRAITASSSEEQLSPKDAGEALTLYRELFPGWPAETQEEAGEVDLSHIRKGIALGKAAEITKDASDLRLLEAAFASIEPHYQRLQAGLERLFESWRKSGIAVKKVEDQPLTSLKDQVLSSYQSNEMTLWCLQFGEPDGEKFNLRVHGYVYVPSLREHLSGALPREDENPVALFLQRYANLSHGRIPFPHETRILILQTDGTLALRDEHMTESRKATVKEVLRLLKTWVEDETPWAAITASR